jgi:hypothetical protein
MNSGQSWEKLTLGSCFHGYTIKTVEIHAKVIFACPNFVSVIESLFPGTLQMVPRVFPALYHLKKVAIHFFFFLGLNPL